MRGRVCRVQLLLVLASAVPMNSSCHLASRVLIQFLWWPLFYLLLARPHWGLSWSAEIPLRLLWTCRPETSCLHSEPELSDLVLAGCASREGVQACATEGCCCCVLLRSAAAKARPGMVRLEEITLPVVLGALCDFPYCTSSLACLQPRYLEGWGSSLSTNLHLNNQCQSYFTTGGLPPIISSRSLRFTTRDFFLQLNTFGHSPYVTTSLMWRWGCLWWIWLAFCQVYVWHI
jgi:hypothetical protein